MPADSPPTPPTDPRTDAQLVAAANAGDASAFDALYFRHRDWVASLAMRFLGDDDLAADVTQETFIYLLSKFPGFRLTARLTTFLYPAVKNLSIAHRRKAKRFARHPTAAPGEDTPDFLDLYPAPPASAPGADADLVAVLSSLPPAHREVVLMRFADGLSLEEIAQALSIPLGTVKSRLHNALATLRADPKVRSYFDPA